MHAWEPTAKLSHGQLFILIPFSPLNSPSYKKECKSTEGKSEKTKEWEIYFVSKNDY